jgi:DNA repair ATPase RecN
MLRELRIRNLAIIDDLKVRFEDGFNVLTGETGAGKSIIVDSLGLALGSRESRCAPVKKKLWFRRTSKWQSLEDFRISELT